MNKSKIKLMSSMTGFSRKTVIESWGNASCEIRSVNQRYLELFFRISEEMRGLEPVLRERFRQVLVRGKVECHIKLDLLGHHHSAIHINESLAKNVIEAAKWIKNTSGEGEINPLDVLHWPGVMASNMHDMDKISEVLIELFDETLHDFVQMREREGEQIKQIIILRLDAIGEEIHSVRQQLPFVLQWQRDRLLAKLEEIKLQTDPMRLEQELLFLAQKIDVAEELDRLEMHLTETRAILSKPESVGRRLDFMMQELNREANTLASKSINAGITQSAIEMKILIEQMREQIQNIE